LFEIGKSAGGLWDDGPMSVELQMPPQGGWAWQPLEDDYPVIADFETSRELNVNYTGRASNASISTYIYCVEWV